MANSVAMFFAGITPPVTNPSVLFNPNSFGANLKIWVRADQGVTVASGKVTAMAGQGYASGVSLTGIHGGINYLANARNGLPAIQNTQANVDPTVITELAASPVVQSSIASVNFNNTDPFVVGLAAYPTANQGYAILGQGIGYDKGGWFVGYRAGKLALWLFGAGGYGNNWLCVRTSYAYTVGTPYSLVVAYSGATSTAADVTIYVNGVADTGLASEGNGVITGGISSTSGNVFAINPGLLNIGDQSGIHELFVARGTVNATQAASLDRVMNASWAIHS